MSAPKLAFLFAALVLVISTPVYASNENTLRVENITSVSDIIDSHFFSLAKTAKIDAPRASLFGSWSPDGSRLLIVSAIRQLGDVGLTAAYVLNADGTDMKEIASTLNNTRSKSLDMGLGSWNPDGNRVVIFTNIFRVRDFFVIADPDGTLFKVVGKNLTTVDSIRDNILNIEWQRDFSWSPDGTKALIVMSFITKNDAGFVTRSQLYVVDENGFILRQLTNESIETNVWNPIWSHDGKKIAFNGKNLWIINEDGTGLRQFAQASENIYAEIIGWSHDDSKIFYQINNNINSVNADGTGAIEVISSDNRTMIFSLSPDGQMMIFTASTIYNDGTITSKLYVADSDGRNQKLLSEVTGRDVIKAGWSPKGDKITFIENGNLYTINPDGSGRATIALTSFNYAWRPSGDYIAFSADIDKKTGKDVDHSRFWPKEDSYTRQVFVTRPDGTERVRITQNDQINYDLGIWSPDGSRLLVDSFGYNFDKFDLLMMKFSGYDEVMSLQAPSSVQQGDEFAIKVKSMSKPVENAIVTFNGREIGKTNETGFLKYSLKEAGNYSLSAAKQGFRTANKSIMIEETPSEQSSQELTLTSTPQITKPATLVVTPKAPGFDSVLVISILPTIHLFKRRYN